LNILITDCDHGFYDPEEKITSEAGFCLYFAQCKEPQEVINAGPEADALICQYVEINQTVLQSLPRCKVVGRYGVGLDNIDVSVATKLGVKVVHTPGFCSCEVADHTMGLILSLTRQIAHMNKLMKASSDIFRDGYTEALKYLTNVERSGRQILGIIGFGNAGREVAKRALSFSYKVISYDPYKNESIFSASGVQKVEFNELLQQSDIITLHAPLTEETNQMIRAETLALMKPSAYLINTARGPIVDDIALAKALEVKQIAGAALDVTPNEPLPPDHPFMKLDNVILTPHIAFYSQTSIYDLKSKTAQYTVNALRNNGEFHIANPEVLKK